MDRRRPLAPIENDDLEQIAASIRSEDEVAGRVLAKLLDDERVADRVTNVDVGNAVLASRGQNIDTSLL